MDKNFVEAPEKEIRRKRKSPMKGVYGNGVLDLMMPQNFGKKATKFQRKRARKSNLNLKLSMKNQWWDDDHDDDESDHGELGFAKDGENVVIDDKPYENQKMNLSQEINRNMDIYSKVLGKDNENSKKLKLEDSKSLEPSIAVGKKDKNIAIRKMEKSNDTADSACLDIPENQKYGNIESNQGNVSTIESDSLIVNGCVHDGYALEFQEEEVSKPVELQAITQNAQMQVVIENNNVAIEKLDIEAVQEGFGTRKNPALQKLEDVIKIHHARIRDVSRGASKFPTPSRISAHIFQSSKIEATFEKLGLLTRLAEHCTAPITAERHQGLGLKRPTICQQMTLPLLLKGKNLMLKSETGSGKTLAYLLPIINELARETTRVTREDGTLAIVLAPTRELTVQIYNVLAQVIQPFISIVPGCISGGERRKSEKARLRKGVTILVSTPGRLLDHLKATQSFKTDLLRWLVLDEADRLMDLGFEKQIDQIFEKLDIASKRKDTSRVLQTIMVSATVTAAVSTMGQQILGSHVHVDADTQVIREVDHPGEGITQLAAAKELSLMEPTMFQIPQQLVQQYMVVTQKLRLPALCAAIKQRCNKKVIVFVSTCDSVDFHYALFEAARWPIGATDSSLSNTNAKLDIGKRTERSPAEVEQSLFGTGFHIFRLHGNVPQSERLLSYRGFSECSTGLLICTDVAARGLDLPIVDWIIQYDPPLETSDYVHRAGRTARKGQQGSALLFLMPSETEYLNILAKQGLNLSALSLQATLASCATSRHVQCRYPDEEVAFELQEMLQSVVRNRTKDLLLKARAAFQTHVRGYATHCANTKHIFQVRGLHLGHVARSFALKDAPAAIKVTSKGQVKGKLIFNSKEGGKRMSLGSRSGLNKMTKILQSAEFM